MRDVLDWNKSQDATVLVAHTDDETIFMGGTLLTLPWRWKIYSLTYNIDDEPRGTQFKKAMEMYKSMGVDIVDYGCLGQKDSLEPLTEAEQLAWKDSIKDF